MSFSLLPVFLLTPWLPTQPVKYWVFSIQHEELGFNNRPVDCFSWKRRHILHFPRSSFRSGFPNIFKIIKLPSSIFFSNTSVVYSFEMKWSSAHFTVFNLNSVHSISQPFCYHHSHSCVKCCDDDVIKWNGRSVRSFTVFNENQIMCAFLNIVFMWERLAPISHTNVSVSFTSIGLNI